MELCKQSLLNIQIFTDPITKNFVAIQEEFKKINESILQLKEQNDSFRHFKNTVQKLIESNKLAGQTSKQRVSNLSVANTNNDTQSQIDRKLRHHEDKSKGSDSDYLSQQVNEIHKNSETVLSNSQHQIMSVLHDTSNLPQMTKTNSHATSNKDPRNSKEVDHQFLGKKPSAFDSSTLIKNSPSENKTLLQQILQIRQRLEELQQVDNSFKGQIEKLEKQNQKFRKIFGVKKNTIKKQATSNADSSQKSKKLLSSVSKKSISSQLNFEAQSQKLNPSDETGKEDEEQNFDFQCFKDLKEDIDKIRDYLSGKMRAIDTNFAQVNSKIHGFERTIDILERTDNSLKEDIQFLQKTSNQTKLNMTELHEKSMQMTKSRFKKNFNDTDQMNGENRKQDGQIEERIINLLDQMEQLKEDYQQIFFGKKQNDDNSKDIDPQVAQKRKRLALKLNTNSVPDEKLRKELSNCKRDLKKLREEFDFLMNGVNTGTHETKTLIIKPNETKEEWKSLSTKINKFKQELQSQIKELEGKITANNELAVVLNEFEVGIQECKILLKKKLDIVDFDKTTKRIESRLNNFIRQTFEKEGYTNEQDAIMSKQPWFCLSCDVELKTYSGKMNKNSSPVQTSSGEKFVGKKVNPQSHMVRRNQNGRLPSIAI